MVDHGPIGPSSGVSKAHEYSVEDKDRDLLVAEHAGLGRGVSEYAFGCPPAKIARTGTIGASDRIFERFQGLASKYHGARLYFLVDTMEGFLAEFRSESYRDFGVTIQVPAWFFDLPFRHEDARSAATAIRELLTTAKEVDKRRVPQNYEGPDARIEGVDLVQDLARVIASETTKQNPKVWVIAAPAGQGKPLCSIRFSCICKSDLLNKRKSSLSAHARYRCSRSTFKAPLAVISEV